jgi:hypothetical protein
MKIYHPLFSVLFRKKKPAALALPSPVYLISLYNYVIFLLLMNLIWTLRVSENNYVAFFFLFVAGRSIVRPFIRRIQSYFFFRQAEIREI